MLLCVQCFVLNMKQVDLTHRSLYLKLPSTKMNKRRFLCFGCCTWCDWIYWTYSTSHVSSCYLALGLGVMHKM